MLEGGLLDMDGYRTRRWLIERPAVPSAKLLQWQFTATKTDVACVTDMTNIRTWQGRLYPTAVRDLLSHKVVGCAVGPTMDSDLGLYAVLAPVKQRRRHETSV